MPLESLLLHIKVHSKSHYFRLKACAKMGRLEYVKNRQKSPKFGFEPCSQINQNTYTQNFEVNGKHSIRSFYQKRFREKNLTNSLINVQKTWKISFLPLVKNAEQRWSVKFRMAHKIQTRSRDVTKFTGWCDVIHI